MVCLRWYNSKDGPPFGGTLYFDGVPVTAAWGPYREKEAAEELRRMDEQLKAKKP
ncbi:MAG TPA: hypothetical protein VFV19_09855 [Candidatus Polarisedimenticolaceae bacterium]|nr:hypothetical protein [Candidatus Polarisedimenticolaceae bacterium]